MKNGWQRKQLGELAELKGRIGWRGLTAKEYTKQGPLFLSVHSLNYGDYVDFRDAFHISEERYAESPEIMLQSNDILICKDGAGIGKLGILGEIPDRATINSSLLLIRSGKYILPKYLYHCLTSPYFQDIVQSRLNGATTPHLYQRDITEFPVVLPPLSEQHRIVEILDKAFADIAKAKANAERNLRNARELFESQLNEVFTKKGEGWVEKKLEEIGKTQTGSTPKTSDQTNYGDFISFVKPGDFNTDGTLDYDKAGLSESGAEGARIVPAGSVLMVCIGATIGKCGYCDQNVTTNQQVNALTPTDGSSNRFIYYQMLTETFHRKVIHASGQATLPIINKSKWSALSIWLPPKVAEQNMIAAKLDALSEETQRLSRVYERKLDELEALKKSILHKAFSGEL
jgi:type I restriction enzyme S subunit